MLIVHIILTILKIIGIIFLAILGLILLVLLSVLFVPLRYSGKARKEGTDIEASLSISWFLHFIHGTVSWKDEKIDWNLRILGISLKKLGKLLEKRQKENQSQGHPKEQETVFKEKTEERKTQQDTVTGQAQENQVSESEQIPESKDDFSKEFQRNMESPEEEGFKPAPLPAPALSLWEKIAGKLRAVLQAVKGFFGKLWKGIRWIFGIPGRIFRGIKKICFTIQGICDKIEKWKSFVQEEDTREAWKLVKKSISGVIRHVLPRKIRGSLLFGFEDPARTGQILAAVSPFYPLYAKSLALSPVFDRAVLEGKISFRGRIYGVFFVKTALHIWMDKHVKKTVKRFRQLSSS